MTLTASDTRQGAYLYRAVGQAARWEDGDAAISGATTQSAKPAVPMMAVKAAEINNEMVTLSQSVTVHNFQVGLIAKCPTFVVTFLL